jgi:iron-sulfur cluster assembly accessory protein
MTSLTLSAAAARQIAKIVAGAAAPGQFVRLAVQGGGCSGYSYKFDFDAAFDAAEDIAVERDGARLVVDKTSLELLQGSEVDYSESLMEAGFKVNNPNAVSSCGCGTSFALAEI